MGAFIQGTVLKPLGLASVQAPYNPVTASPRKLHGGMSHMGLQRTGSMPPACFPLPQYFHSVCVAAGFASLLAGVGMGALLVPPNLRPRCETWN